VTICGEELTGYVLPVLLQLIPLLDVQIYRSVESVEKVQLMGDPLADFNTVEAFAWPVSVFGEETLLYEKPVVS
jgi:hypothetical protein